MGTTVLIVDDHPTFRKYARRVLAAGGFEIVGEATDAAEAVEATRLLAPAAVLLDVLLPDRSGLEVARELAAASSQPAVVLTSSRSSDELGVALTGTGARAFIPKDTFSSAAFAAALEPS